jgi:hypothetical protein
VIFFIEHPSSIHNLTEKRITPAQPVRKSFGGADEKIQGKATLVNRLIDANGLLNLIARRHDHQQINVAIGRRIAVGVRAEKDDFVRMELPGDLPREPTDRGHGGHIWKIKPGARIFSPGRHSTAHKSILTWTIQHLNHTGTEKTKSGKNGMPYVFSVPLCLGGE